MSFNNFFLLFIFFTFNCHSSELKNASTEEAFYGKLENEIKLKVKEITDLAKSIGWGPFYYSWSWNIDPWQGIYNDVFNDYKNDKNLSEKDLKEISTLLKKEVIEVLKTIFRKDQAPHFWKAIEENNIDVLFKNDKIII